MTSKIMPKLKKKKTTNTGIIVSTVLTEVKTMNLEEVLQFCFYQTVQFPQIPLPGKPRGILPLVSAGVVLVADFDPADASVDFDPADAYV